MATTNKKFIPITQARFPQGYISLLSGSRIPNTALATMYNYWLEQDAVPRPRPPFIPYGAAYAGTCIGQGTYTDHSTGTPVRYEISMQVTATNEVQTLSITGSPTGGTFTLTFGGHTTSSIAYNASASTVQTALRALSSIGSTGVVCSGGSLPGTAVIITFQGSLANTDEALITHTDSLTGGTSPAVVITETTKGGNRGAIYTRKDGAAWTLITGNYRYNASAWATFVPGAQLSSSDTEDQRVYVVNGVDNLSYLDLGTGGVVVYTALGTPTISAVTVSAGLSGSTYNQYYRVTANNDGGESAAAASMSAAISTARDYWTSSTQSIAVTWGAVTGATSYNVYTADQSGNEAYLATVNGTSFTDNGTIAINIYKPAPNNDSSGGPIMNTLINIDNVLYGCGDPNNLGYLWYSGSGQHFGDFSFNPLGGGYVGIDYGGDTVPTVPFPFHDGKGNPAPSVLTRGAAGRGKLYHLQQSSTTVGSTTLAFLNVYEANAQDGCPSPRGVSIYNSNAYYLTGAAAKTTGTKADVVNILATDTLSDAILPDIQRLNLQALPNYVNIEFLGKIYFFVPTEGSATNNEIWILDLTRGGLWIIKWELADGSSVQHAWLYEDNSGLSHLCVLTTNNEVLELDLLRVSTPTQDNGIPFATLISSGSMVFDAGGVAEISSYFTYFKYLHAQGTRTETIYGLDETNNYRILANNEVSIAAAGTRLIYGSLSYSNPDGSSVYSGHDGTVGAPGPITSIAPESFTDALEVDEIVSEQEWQIATSGSGCDHLLSSVTTTAYSIPRRYAGQS